MLLCLGWENWAMEPSRQLQASKIVYPFVSKNFIIRAHAAFSGLQSRFRHTDNQFGVDTGISWISHWQSHHKPYIHKVPEDFKTENDVHESGSHFNWVLHCVSSIYE